MKYEVTLRLSDYIVEVEADDESLAIDAAIERFLDDPYTAIDQKHARRLEEAED